MPNAKELENDMKNNSETAEDKAAAKGQEAPADSEAQKSDTNETSPANEAEPAAEDAQAENAEPGAEAEAPEPGDEAEGAPGDKDKKDLKIEELNDRLMRQMAEFENFRKRSEREKSQMFETGAKSIVEKILPVVDNFERGLAALPEGEEKNAFAEGMEMVYRQLVQGLESMGVTPIEAVGAEFDPELHNAVMQVASEEYGSGIVAQELLKGYRYKDSVVRHSMVAVVE